ncbi:MAG: DUF3810 family protein [Eubacterium sp.]|nr:DUF3810 family protein [Eubacterium sp.]
MVTKKKVFWKIWIVLIIATLLLIIPGFFPAFCDWYTDNIYGILCDGISKVTCRVPFAIGEMIMYLGAILIVGAVIILVVLVFLRKSKGYRRFCRIYFKTILMIFTCIVLWYMPTWYIPFRGSVLGVGEREVRTSFTNAELETLITYIVEGANAAAEEIEVEEDGTVIFPMGDESRSLIDKAMTNLSSEYPRLNGFYPPMKVALCSDILERMDIGGYNYPFSMEPTCNKYLSPLGRYIIETHELSHHKGYYKENEGNFLSELALVKSDNPYLRLSGYLDMYYWVMQDYKKSIGTNSEPEAKFSERVTKIKSASYAIKKEIYDADSHPIDEMPKVEKVITKTSDKGWEIQGDILQENSYDGVTLLLLQYYDGKIY